MEKTRLLIEIENKLNDKRAFGKSRHLAKQDGSAQKQIHSLKTMEQYQRQCRLFSDYCLAKNPKIRHVSQTKKYIYDYLQDMIDDGKSPSSIQTARSALSKLFGYTVAQDLELPKKTRASIKNSRDPNKEYLKHFSETKNAELVNFCKKTALRKHELLQLTGDCLKEIDGEYYLHVRQGKGGKERYAKILGSDEQVVQRMKNTKPNDLVWTKENGWKDGITPHKYRSDYVAEFYKEIARPIDRIPFNERYYCRKDMAGKVLDKKALLEISKNLGHNRISVIAGNYAHKL